MRRFFPFLAILIIGIAHADTLRLRDGKVIQGTYFGGDSRNIRMVVGDKVETYPVSSVASLHLGESPEPSTSAAQPATVAPTPTVRTAAPAPTPAPANEIPVGTVLFVRMIDPVDSEVDKIGQTFLASVDEPVMLQSRIAIPRGTEVVVKLVEDRNAGKLTGRSELTLDLVSLKLNGKTVALVTEEVTTASESRTGQTAKVVGGMTALGAIIGAIGGGGKGAAIGAVSGAGAGTAIQVLTKGPRVRIPSETRLQFTLQQPIRP